MPATNQIARDVYLEASSRMHQYGDRTDVIVSSRPFGKSNTLSAGFDYDYVDYLVRWNSSFGGASVTDLQNTKPGTFISDDRQEPQFRTHTHHTAFFEENSFAASSKVSLVGGVRLDVYAVDLLDMISNTPAKRTYTPPSWRGGVVYSVKPTLSVYGQVAQATDTVRNIISSSASQMLLDPTIGRQVEGGVKQSLGGQRIEWTVAGYYIKKTKLVAPVPGRPGESQQIGAQSSRGVEATAAINLPNGVRIDGNLAVLDARFDDFSENAGGVPVSRVGNTPVSVPEHSANLWLTWNAPRSWQFRGGLRSVGRRYSDNANSYSVPAYTVIDAGVRKGVTARLAIDLHLLNVANELYATDVYANGFAPQWMLGAPRSAEVALTVRF